MMNVYKLNARRHCLFTVGQVVHILPDAEPVCGVTLLAGELYLLRWKERYQVEVYDVISYGLLRRLTVPEFDDVADMTSCEHYRCVYVVDHRGKCVHRLDAQGTVTWAVKDEPQGISVNTAHNVIVTFRIVHKIKEFSSHGDLLRELTLPGDVMNPWHVIQTRSGQFIVCHGGVDDPVNRVCMMSADGRHIVHSHGGQQGKDTGQYDGPFRLAVDDNEFVFVVDINNRRVTLLSPTLEYVRQVVSRDDQFNSRPTRLCLDTERRRLYITDSSLGSSLSAGRVLVVRV